MEPEENHQYNASCPFVQELVGNAYRVVGMTPDGVYLADDRQGQPQRIRVLKQLAKDEENRLEREYQACRHLQHANLAPIRSMGRVPGAVWMARPEFQAQRMDSVWDRPQPVGLVLSWMSGMLDGLATLSREGLVYDNWQEHNLLFSDRTGVLADVGFREHRLPTRGKIAWAGGACG